MSTLVSTPRRRRRATLAAVLAMVAMPLVTSSADAGDTDCAEGQACIEVRIISTEDGKDTRLSTSYFTVADITTGDDLVPEPKYWTRSSLSKPPEETPRPATALPLRALLQRIGEDALGDTKFSEVPLRGIPSVLSADDLRAYDDPDLPFLDDLQPGLYAYPNDDRIGYIRPQRSEDDLNRTDHYITPSGGRLILTFHTTGGLLEPKLGVSDTSVDTKTKNKFAVTMAKSPGTRIVRYRWNFGDGTEYYSKYKDRTHQYTKVGTYPAFVQARGADGSYGRTASIKMKVGKPPKPPTPSSPGGTGGGGGGGSGAGSGSGYIPPFIPNEPRNPPPVDNPPTDDLPTAPVDDGLQEVEGFVLAGAGAEQGDSIPGTQATTQPTEATELSTSRKIGGAVIGALAVILLLGLGAEIETRWASTRLAHLRRRA